MDRKQLVADRARTMFGECLEGIMETIRQDRQEMRGWEEPGHVRAVLRRSISEAGQPTQEGATALAEMELSRTAGEPDRGQQREAMGQLLEAGLCGLEKMARTPHPDLSCQERVGLECVMLVYGRPALLLQNDRLGPVPPTWRVLDKRREEIEAVSRGVGRIELLGHPEYDWAGTGFMVNETTLLTTRRTMEIFCEHQNGTWQFRPGISAWMDFRCEAAHPASAGCRIRSVLAVHECYDLSLLEVEPSPSTSPIPLLLASQPAGPLEGREIYMVGYPVRDSRCSLPENLSHICREMYNVKRLHAGRLGIMFPFRDVQLLHHDCGFLGPCPGSCIVDMETHQVLGLHLSGRYLEPGTAIPLWVLREDPMMTKTGVTFAAVSTPRDLETCANQLERLARSRFWPEARDTIASLYRRAYGYQT